MLLWVTVNQAVAGVTAASGVWLIGITIEMIFITFALRYTFGSFTGQSGVLASLPNNVSKKVNFKRIIKFFIPIAIMAFLARFVQPVVQSGIVRSSIGTHDLAAYGVSWTLVMIFVGPLDQLHQCSLVYARELNHHNWQRILKFSLAAGAIVSFIFAVLALTAGEAADALTISFFIIKNNVLEKIYAENH